MDTSKIKKMAEELEKIESEINREHFQSDIDLGLGEIRFRSYYTTERGGRDHQTNDILSDYIRFVISKQAVQIIEQAKLDMVAEMRRQKKALREATLEYATGFKAVMEDEE